MVEITIPVTLDGKEYQTVWDANTMREYERAMHNIDPQNPVGYWQTINALSSYWDKNGDALQAMPKYEKTESPEITRRRNRLVQEIGEFISSESFIALLWAALHGYDDDDNIVHYLPINRIGRFLKPMDTINIVFLMINGHHGNMPTKKELGEASGVSDSKVVTMTEAIPKSKLNGGLSGTGLPEDAFDSPGEKQAG